MFDSGWFAEIGLGSDFGSRLFLHASKAAPSGALAFLEGDLGGKSRDDLLKFVQGRRETVQVLERIAGSEEYFGRAARLLLSLAEAENEGFANNASGTFCNLFVPRSSETGPKVLLDALKHAAATGSRERGLVVARACGKALEDSAFWRVGGGPAGADGRSAAEIAVYRRGVLHALTGLLSDADRDVVRAASEAVLKNARFMLNVPVLAQATMGALSAILESGAHSEDLLDATSRITEFDKGLDPEILKGLHLMQDKIAGTGFQSRLKRYVGMSAHIDAYTGTNSVHARQAELERLADEASEPSVLEPELAWLVTDKAKYAHRFGYELAHRDAGRALFPMMLGALADSGTSGRSELVGGYLRRVREEDEGEWDAKMEEVYGNAGTRALLPGITRVSGVTASSLGRILKGVRDQQLKCDALSVSKYSNDLPEPVIRECVELLLAREEIPLAVELLYFHFAKAQKPLPEKLALEALVHDRALNGPAGSMPAAWEWGQAGLALARQCPDCATKIAEAAFAAFGSSELFARPDAPPVHALGEIARLHPAEVWRILSGMVGPPSDARARRIQSWLRGSMPEQGGAMSHIPMREILAWVAGDEQSRAAHLAEFVPHDWRIVRELASAYGHRPDVRRSLDLNLSGEIWTGSEAAHYRAKKKETEGLLEGESDPGVLAWLRYRLERLESDLERARLDDERVMMDVYS